MRSHQRRAHAICRAILLSHEDAEDAVQDGFLHAYKALGRFRPGQPFVPWLFRIMTNASFDLLRRNKVRETEVLQESIPIPFRDPGESDELRGRLQWALAQLGERQRAVVVLHDVEGFIHQEIGAMLGIPIGTARSDLHHGRMALRKLLSDYRASEVE